MTTHFRALALSAPALALLLSACGGGSGTPSNRAPVAVADSVTMAWNTSSAPIAVLANDSDPDNDAFRLVSAAQPAHGSVAIDGSTIIYRPVSGYAGSDQFTYVIRDRFDATATGTVTVAVRAEMTLQSRVVGVASPTVTATVGDQTFTTTGDASGAYSLPISASAGNAFITLAAEGPTGVRLRSLVGEVGQFGVRAANTDGVLADGTDSVFKLGSLSTARTALAMAANSGAEPTTQAALDAANSLIDGDALLQRAATIRQVMSGTVALPAGVADTAALVQDSAAYTTLVEGQLTANADALTEDQRLVQIDASQTVPFATTLTEADTTVYSLRSGRTRTAMVWTLNPDGSALLDAAAATWAVDNGLLTLTFAAPQTLQVPNAAGGFTSASVTALTIRRHVGSSPLGNASVRYTVAGAAAGDWQPAAYQAMSRLRAPTSAELTSGRYVGVPTPTGAPDTLVLAADGTGRFDRTAAAVTWTLSDTALVLTHADGTQQTLTRLAAYADGEERWLVRQLGESVSTQCDCMVVRQGTDLAFTAAELPAQWLYQTANDVVVRWHDGFGLNADGSGNYIHLTLGGSPQARQPVSWAVDTSGRAVLRTFALPGGGLAGACPAGQTCTVAYERTWTKLAQSGDKVLFLLQLNDVRAGTQTYSVNAFQRRSPA